MVEIKEAPISMFELKKPEYANCIIISYEGFNLGDITIGDIDVEIIKKEVKADGIPNYGKDPKEVTTKVELTLKCGQYAIIEAKDKVIKSIQDGAIRWFMDPNSSGCFRTSPPLVIYRLSAIR